eukprot:XP_011671563.1 PREDICTED: uncharacterized protein LOC105441789 isoform X2 [Strongylocentrotus purpuratus]
MSDLDMAAITRTCFLILFVSFCFGFPKGEGLTTIPTMTETVTIEYTTLPASESTINQTGNTTMPTMPPIDQTGYTTLPTSAPPIDQTEPGSTKKAATRASSNSPTETERPKKVMTKPPPTVKASSVLDLSAAFGAVAVILLIVIFFVLRGLYQTRNDSKLEITEIPLENVTSGQ